ncbi:hypothetical protein [Microvirga guangxiensis]|uniref:Uncharacterized protein n=1 Tax=Microvirga guangxiensis TaxID=549386 RepID=A0A1G5LEC5_9HYPH|nr:hypothetical protein [Microvirga guangxiensis]SCZ11283.1 hypothetical protein SAMN02927923_04227 [Microvirga guangxiensis]
MAGRRFLELQELPLDRAHSRHEAVEFAEKELFVLLRFLDLIEGRAVTDPLQSIGKLPVQKPHGSFQIQEFLM